MSIDFEKAIRAIVRQAVDSYASGFVDRHLSELDDEDGTINMKIHNIFIAALGEEIQFYSALMRSLDSSLGNMIEKMAVNIASLNYVVKQHVEGVISQKQTEFIADLLEQYKRNVRKPLSTDYSQILKFNNKSDCISKRHESDYYLFDEETNMHYLIELKIGGDLDNKKSRSEKEALLEQYCILANSIGSIDYIKIYFATAYNRYGEENEWKQMRVRQFFATDELLISQRFWNFICKSPNGFSIVIDEYTKNSNKIVESLQKIKLAYLSN